jgi:integrase
MLSLRRQYVRKLNAYLDKRLVTELTPGDVASLQRLRQAKGLSGRQINAEVGTLRAILRYHGHWSRISGRIRMPRQNLDAGRALSVEEINQLIAAILGSRSAALYPFFLLSLDAGLRPSEIRSLRRSSVRACWCDGTMAEAEVIVARSKTEAGVGRLVPLTRRARGALASWMLRFPDATPENYLFPFHRAAISGFKRRAIVHDVNLDRPMSPSSYRTAFATARKRSGVRCRFYDARHTFITRLAENPAISEETIRQLAGHVSPRMLSRYAHIRARARREAIARLEVDADVADSSVEGGSVEAGSPQNPPQSATAASPKDSGPDRKTLLNLRVAPRAGFEPATRRLTAVCSTD